MADARGSTPRPGDDGCALLAGKLAPPRLHVAVLPRTRIQRRIDRAVQRRAVSIIAPAGSGKTVACASWSTDGDGAHDVAWLTLDSEDNRPRRFWPHLAAALGRVHPSLRVPAPDRAPTMDLVGEIVEAVSGRDRPIVLVMDDVHELDRPEILHGLDLLLRHAPPQLRLLLSGRRRPALQLSRLRVSGDLVEMGAEDLAWTESEAAEYFRAAGLPVDTKQVAELVRRTGGWSTGLRLACLWLKDRNGADPRDPDRRDPDRGGVNPGDMDPESADPESADPESADPESADPESADPETVNRRGLGRGEMERLVRGFTGNSRIVGDYFRDEVISRQDPEIRRFLLRTSIASPLDAELAGALTGTADAARILDRLSRENCFLETIDADPPGYGFQPLFREFLQAELGRESPEDVPHLLREAARRHRSNGRPLDALRAAVAGADWGHAAEILAEDDVRVLLRAGDGELSAILARLPPELTSTTPMVALAHAWIRLITGDPDAAGPYLEAAERSAGTVEPHPGRLIAALNLLRVWMSGDCAPEDLSTARQALRRTGGVPSPSAAERRAAGCLLLALGLAHAWNAEFVSAGTALRRAVRELEAGDFPALTGFATACAALADAIRGDLTGAEETIGAVQSDPARPEETGGLLRTPASAPDGPLRPHPIADLALAWVHLERDEPADVHRLLDRIEPWPRRRPPGEGPVSAFATLIRARALVAEGETAAARSCLAELHRRRRPPTRLIQAVTLLDVAWFPAADLPGALPLDPTAPNPTAPEPPAALKPTTDEAGPSPLASNAVAVGRLHLMRNDPARALAAVRDCLSGTAGETRPLDSIAALLVASAAHRRLGAVSLSAELLDQALELAEPHRARRVFLDGGRSVRSLLTILVPPNDPRLPFGTEILRRFERGAVNPQGEEAPSLTQCELAVLRFLPSHMTNKEIAEDLFLSVNTVKTHLRSVYRKLGVTTRREAINQAARRGFV
ncbi:helix-turn-helix transcriptional regulator [Streptosporangium lutulentum]|uniref:helix-turn-helix transcriptional regulator n=1 Tax=Streptosporangium lutulentum TaxID=1461250 RepID=UPI00362CA076